MVGGLSAASCTRTLEPQWAGGEDPRVLFCLVDDTFAEGGTAP